MAVPALLDGFLELCALATPPGSERPAADWVGAYLDAVGLDWEEDAAGATVGSDAGNILCRLPGRADGGTPLVLCAHLDTVPPDGPIEPVVDDDGVVRNAAGTILGADNKSAVLVMLDAARRIVAEEVPHGGVELLFTVKEEVGLLGAYAFDTSRLEARAGFVYDQAAPIGEVITGAPFARAIEARFHGHAAHAGMAPEEGRSAVVAAARAIADLRLGRVDELTTANVGSIKGGTARNIVPEHCVVTAEARSHDEAMLTGLVQEMLEAFAFAASVSDCTVETEVRGQYRGYRFTDDDLPIRIARDALARRGLEPTYKLSGGAADANVFNERGLPCANLGNGMAEIHTPQEHIAVDDLERMVDVTLELVAVAREG